MYNKEGGNRQATWSGKTRPTSTLTVLLKVMLVGIPACNGTVSLTGNFSENDRKIQYKRRISPEMLQVVDLSREKVHSLK